jgi:hypothetical protein
MASALRTACVSAGLSMTSGSNWCNSRALFRVNPVPVLADVGELPAAMSSEVERGNPFTCGDKADDRKHPRARRGAASSSGEADKFGCR